ncbi:LacI family transcriptional regulator [Lacrimispora sphenoides]|jgi:LacI family transcriptional regulator|uniref:LacI family transcriptional regulator n=1 Tax=Lacrimispora sphenoides JCM 1415 TaxID=1297793 RepID=A0ABY1CH85_9FIRM|nr:LacI family DNA-binding transcriptional regulator [Lacrimispora sphenoides]SET68045.1 LacI family transcriptional regulator [Lacrimispora sphenoides]SEU04589.1 LacI family transcriptional regulator [[Clostridium] sphenoides JCM 1415]SUY48900.1 LacI family transcriptional regulator [Lacrimispora sphenoides]
MATIKEISQLADVSIATVSRVLNQDDTIVVSPEVKKRIFRIAHELKYVPPRRRHAQKERGIVIGVADWHIIRKDRTNIRLSSLDLIVKSMSGKNDVRFVRLDKNQPGQYDGIMAFGVFSEEEMEFLRMQSFAIVFINSDPKDYEYDSIVMDFNKGIHEMLDYLMDQKKYCSVGYIGGIYEEGQVRIGYRRLEGIRGAFMQRGFYEEGNFYIGDISRESGYHLAKQAIQSGRLPEAVLLGSEEVAEGALEAFQDAGLRVPKDVAVVIYKDIETLESKWPSYTKVRMFPDIVWQTAIKLLLEQIQEGRKDNMTIFLPTKLEVGDSA